MDQFMQQLASFPDSTPQLFIALCIKSWGVESGNEASSNHTFAENLIFSSVAKSIILRWMWLHFRVWLPVCPLSEVIFVQ